MKHILITGDFLMTRTATQEYHVKWFSGFFGKIIEIATNKEIKCSKFISDSDHFSRRKFFSLSNIIVDEAITHFWFDYERITLDSKEYLQKCIGDNILLSYELSEETRNVLDSSGIQYIDVWLHPIRFLDDNFFAFGSNVESVRDALSNHEIDDNIFYIYAERNKVQSYMGWNKENIDKHIIPNSALFVGQTMTDKAVCRNGKMLSLIDFKEKFIEATRCHEHVYYSKHPMLKGELDEIDKFISVIKNASITNIEGYKLLASENIKKVYSISSSLVYEASFYSKEIEYFFRPVIDLNKNSKKRYYSIFEVFISPHFWSDILSVVLSFNPNISELRFIDNRSKIRDMLSLYYNSHVFDKNDFVFKYTNKQEKKQKMKTKSFDEKFLPNESHYQRFIDKIKNVDVVSFDIFDTLIERPISTPSAIFDLIEHKIISIAGNRYENFKNARLAAKLNVPKELYNEEVSLALRYAYIFPEVDSILCNELEQIEKNKELEICYRKEIGFELYKYALENGKKIIFITDIFFETTFLKILLEKCGYDSELEIFNSNEIGLLKSTGNLYKYVINKINVEPEKILHIGDNKKSDIEKAKLNGLNTFYVQSGYDLINDLSPILKYTKYTNKTHESVVQGLQIKNLSKRVMVTNQHGFAAGEPYNFGYSVLGQLFFSLALWLINSLKEKKVSKIYFLSRDGDIVRRCYEILSSQLKVYLPEPIYLLCSRRAIRVANLINENAIVHEFESVKLELENARSLLTIRELLTNRFGCDKFYLFPAEFIVWLDIEASTSTIKKIYTILKHSEVQKIIIENAQYERENLKAYYEQEGIVPNQEIIYFDIGHNGTLQKGINELMGINKSVGYYFITYEKIKENLDNLNHTYCSFIESNEIYQYEKYRKYALIFETIFLNHKQSLINVTNENNIITFKFLDLGRKEEKRIEFITEVHNGICDFCTDIINVYSESFCNVSIAYLESLLTFDEFLSSPNWRDSSIFSGVCIENYFSGRDIRYIVPPIENLEKYNDAIWREGSVEFHQYIYAKNSKAKIERVLPVTVLRYIFGNKYYVLKHKFKKKYPRLFYNLRKII